MFAWKPEFKMTSPPWMSPLSSGAGAENSGPTAGTFPRCHEQALPLPPRCSPLFCPVLMDSLPSLFNYFTCTSSTSFSGSEANYIGQVLE